LKIKREKCDFCGVCVETCQNNALEICGKYMSTQEIINEIMRDRKFYETSNGGITLSGGEPLMQFEFIISLLKEMKNLDLHTALDTSGYIIPDRFTRILELVDLILFDVKTLDPYKHKDLTGVPNDRILQNLKLCLNHPIETIIRIPVIYGYNFIDLQKELTKQILELKELGFTQFQLIPYHKFGEQKYQMLGQLYSVEIESNQLEKIKHIAHQLKAKVNIDIEIVEPILT
jgi:pyruvate formate lyase activating enzyme